VGDFTKCAKPGDSYSMSETGNWIWALIGSGAIATPGALFAYFMTKYYAGGADWSCVLTVGFFLTLIIMVDAIKTWYYNARLMCIHEEQCAIGTMVDAATLSMGAFGDGDMKFDLLVAPFELDETRDYFRARITDPAGPFGPGPVNPNDDEILANYVAGFPGEKKDRLYITVVHEDMMGGANQAAGRDYQRRYQIRDRVAMGDDAFDHSPPDTLADDPRNPMFRADPHKTLVPYMHCELEGDRFAQIMNNILVGLWTALAAMVALCIVCAAFNVPPWLCGPLGGLLAALLGFLAWLISDAINDPDDHTAQQTDVDVEDPAYDGDTATILPGDVLAIFGDWIMDEEHEKYFELHPVLGIYLICRRDGGEGPPWETIKDLSEDRGDCPYPVSDITAQDAVDICEAINPSETGGVDIILRRDQPRALSTAAGIRR
jgi:hypothetical protein